MEQKIDESKFILTDLLSKNLSLVKIGSKAIFICEFIVIISKAYLLVHLKRRIKKFQVFSAYNEQV